MGDDASVTGHLQVIVHRGRVAHVDIDFRARLDAIQDVTVPFVAGSQRIFRVVICDLAVVFGLEGITSPSIRSRGQTRRKLRIGAQQRAVLRDIEHDAFDRTGLKFQRPISAERAGTGEILRRRHIRPGQLRQPRHESCAVLPLRHITAIEQQIPILAQMLPKRRQLIGPLIERRPIERQTPQIHPPRRTMRHHMDGPQPLTPLQRRQHLRQPIRLRLDQMHLSLGRQPRQQRLKVAQIGSDEIQGIGQSSDIGSHDDPRKTTRALNDWTTIRSARSRQIDRPPDRVKPARSTCESTMDTDAPTRHSPELTNFHTSRAARSAPAQRN